MASLPTTPTRRAFLSNPSTPGLSDSSQLTSPRRQRRSEECVTEPRNADSKPLQSLSVGHLDRIADLLPHVTSFTGVDSLAVLAITCSGFYCHANSRMTWYNLVASSFGINCDKVDELLKHHADQLCLSVSDRNSIVRRTRRMVHSPPVLSPNADSPLLDPQTPSDVDPVEFSTLPSTWRQGSWLQCYTPPQITYQNVHVGACGSLVAALIESRGSVDSATSTPQPRCQYTPSRNDMTLDPSATALCRLRISRTRTPTTPYLFSWKRYYQLLFNSRVDNWRGRIVLPKRLEAKRLLDMGEENEAIDELSVVIDWQYQGGMQGGIQPLCTLLKSDLLLRGRLLKKAGRLEEAFRDFAFATLLDTDCGVARQLASEMCELRRDSAHLCGERRPAPVSDDVQVLSVSLSEEGTGCNSSQPSSSSSFKRPLVERILDAGFDFEHEYSEVMLHQAPMDRGKFLFEVLHHRPTHFAAWLHLYLLCDVVRMWPRALLQKAKSAATQQYQRLICDAWYHFDNREPELALRAAEIAVSLLPRPITAEAAFAFFTLGYVAQFRDTAVEAYQRYLSYDPPAARKAVAYNNLGSILYHRGEYDAAMVWLQQAKVANPSYFMTYKNMGRCLAKQGDRLAAYGELTQAKKNCYPQVSDIYAERSKYAIVVTPDLNEATRLNPRMSYPYRFRSALFMDTGRVDSALEELDTVIGLAFEPADLTLRAAYNKDLNRVAEAVQDMRLALLLDPTSSATLQWLANHDPEWNTGKVA